MPLVLCPACSGQRLLQTKSRRRVSAWDLVLCYMPVAPEMNFMDFCGSWVPPQDRPLLTSSEACECLPACMYMNQCIVHTLCPMRPREGMRTGHTDSALGTHSGFSAGAACVPVSVVELQPRVPASAFLSFHLLLLHSVF